MMMIVICVFFLLLFGVYETGWMKIFSCKLHSFPAGLSLAVPTSVQRARCRLVCFSFILLSSCDIRLKEAWSLSALFVVE